ncbi:hypothetical protein Taro_048565, partial [Colocasia esculenta]|nr:hypothetical protein [Colocasia esculenta]
RRLLYSYHHVVSGFAARLTDKDLASMREMDGFLAAYPDELLPLQTTHSPDFIGLRLGVAGLWNLSRLGQGVIVGVLDTGANPNHLSFSDAGIPRPPAKWKGRCDYKPSECNNKLIGARAFTLGLRVMRGEPLGGGVSQRQPPYDTQGHGTHTASTAAGAFVGNAASYGNARGTAAGMAPRAHLAIYKVCGAAGCPTSDILAGLDAAVQDGVDVVSLSLGGPSRPFYSDSTAIGTFGAMEKGIFVSCAAGNSGPSPGTLSNEAPWMLTVGASTIDRAIRATVRLGNGEEFDGESLFQPSASTFPPTMLPLVYAGACSSFAGVDVRGNVVLCDFGGGIGRVTKGSNVKNAGGAAMILANTAAQGYTTLAEGHVLPASHVSYLAASEIKSYMTSTSSPTATIVFKGTVMGGEPPAPAVAFFSSRGPSGASPGILKPDIIGPGVNILAAWPLPVGPPDARSTFNIISGTSMATPHLSGVAALLKSTHPDWSPAAIKSAMMTTALMLDPKNAPISDQDGNQASNFALGSGQVDPTAANDPGLVYDLGPDDYVKYLCGLYADSQVSLIARRLVRCSTVGAIDESQLNYPSFRVFLDAAGDYTSSITRTVTNVGEPRTTCEPSVLEPPGVSMAVKPSELTFEAVGQKKQYTVTFGKTDTGTATEASGLLVWLCNGNKNVTSPVVVSY